MMFTTLIATGAESRNTRHEAGVGFLCSSCWQYLPVQTGGGTGYARDSEDRLVCYRCCGLHDGERMKRGEPIVLYLSDREGWVTNWPGTLKAPIDYVKRSYHNFAGRDGRRDVWFRFAGRRWHGVCIGDSQLTRCKPLKETT